MRPPSLAAVLALELLHELTDAEAPPLHGETVSIGRTDAYLSAAEGSSAPLPAVMVIHERWRRLPSTTRPRSPTPGRRLKRE
jgi:hypothetical protein